MDLKNYIIKSSFTMEEIDEILTQIKEVQEDALHKTYLEVAEYQKILKSLELISDIAITLAYKIAN